MGRREGGGVAMGGDGAEGRRWQALLLYPTLAYGKAQYHYIDIHKNEGICLMRLFVSGLWVYYARSAKSELCVPVFSHRREKNTIPLPPTPIHPTHPPTPPEPLSHVQIDFLFIRPS